MTPVIDQPHGVKPDLRVGFLLMNHFTLISVAGLVESLRFAADESFSSRQIFCQWEWMTCDNQPIVASCGLPVSPTAPLDFDQPWDYFVLAGGLLEETRQPPAWLLQAVQKLHARQIPLITLCSGSFIAGNAGLLDGKRCAIHFTTRDEFKARFPRAIPVIDQTYINDGGIISSPGGTSIDLAADLIRRHCGDARAEKGLKYLLECEDRRAVVRKRNLEKKQGIADDDVVQRAKDYMLHHLDTPIPLQEVADRMKVSVRQLNQQFLKRTGESATVHWRRIRLEHARSLMANSSHGIHTIAEACGFADASHLILWFRKFYGETPSSFRKRRREVELLMKP